MNSGLFDDEEETFEEEGRISFTPTGFRAYFREIGQDAMHRASALVKAKAETYRQAAYADSRLGAGSPLKQSYFRWFADQLDLMAGELTSIPVDATMTEEAGNDPAT